MYLVDTNVLSEARRRSPVAVGWPRSVEVSSLFISVITFGEIMRGIAAKRSTDQAYAGCLTEWLMSIRHDFQDRAIPVTDEVAIEWGRYSAMRSRGAADALIAATATVHRLIVVTRNVADFQDLPIAVLDPWTKSS